jgi:hypothetical protein
MIRFLSFVAKKFKQRIAETSTWVGFFCLIFWFLNLDSLFFLFCTIAIFLPEEIWDKFAKKQGEDIEEYLEKNKQD